MSQVQFPVDGFADQILAGLAQHDIVVLEGPTGSGKSTRVGQILLRAGYRRVVFTQPRRLPCWSIATHVAKTMGEKLGELVGWKTGEGGKTSRRTRLEFVTDGLERRRFIHGHSVRGADEVLVVDEVHERSVNIDTLLALSRAAKLRGENFKMVVMSATMDTEKLGRYFNTPAIIRVPGRMFSIETQPAGRDIVADAVELATAGRHVLVFVATQGETHSVAEQIRRTGIDADVYSLHAGLEPADQEKIFREPKRATIVVCTNVAETSITIPYINAVVDGGYEMREECFGGVKGLFRREISKASQRQRAGRAGRTAPGVVRHHGSDRRAEFTPPEIVRTPLAETLLDLASDGLSFDTLPFLDHPKAEEIALAKASLVALGFLDSEGHITPNGREAVKYPVECHVDRMILEARQRGCVPEIVEISALMQVGNLQDRRAEDVNAWSRLVAGEAQSDLFAALQAYRKVKPMGRQARKAAGVMAKLVDEVSSTAKKLQGVLDKRDLKPQGKAGDREQILKCVVAGMVDHVFHRESGGYYRDCDNGSSGWRLADESVLRSNPQEWIVGLPFLAGRNKLVKMATAIDPSWLLEVAPHLVSREPGQVVYDSTKDWVERSISVRYRGYEIAREGENVSGEEASKVFCTWLVSRLSYGYSTGDAERDAVFTELRNQLDAARQVNRRAGREVIPVPEGEQLPLKLAELLGNPRCNGDVKSWNALNVFAAELAAQVAAMRPETVEVAGFQHRVDYAAVTPQIVVGEEHWVQLPDRVALPDGSLVAVVFECGGQNYGPSTDIAANKQRAAETLAQSALAAWQAPELSVPTRKELAKNFPALQRVEVCRNALTGQPVCMFGVLLVSASGGFAWNWSQDQSAQQAARRDAEKAAKVVGGLGGDSGGGSATGRTLWGQKL